MIRPVKKSRRRAFTLREVSIAMTLGSTVMMISVGLLHNAFEWSSVARHRRQDDQSYFRLQQDLIGDVHAATTAQVEDNLLKIDTESTQVVYEIDPRSVTRIETREGTAVRREAYRWKIARTLRFQPPDSQNQIRLDAKMITPVDEAEVPIWRSTRATIGLRIRHQNGDIQ